MLGLERPPPPSGHPVMSGNDPRGPGWKFKDSGLGFRGLGFIGLRV